MVVLAAYLLERFLESIDPKRGLPLLLLLVVAAWRRPLGSTSTMDWETELPAVLVLPSLWSRERAGGETEPFPFRSSMSSSALSSEIGTKKGNRRVSVYAPCTGDTVKQNCGTDSHQVRTTAIKECRNTAALSDFTFLLPLGPLCGTTVKFASI